MPPARTALGIDIGGTSVRVGLVGSSGDIIAHREAPTPPDGDPALLSRLVADQVQRILPDGPDAEIAVGIAVPGIWNRETGVMERAVNLRLLEGRDIRQLFADALGRPVLVETDVNAAAWAQWRAFRPAPRRFVYVSIGTGVGGGVILEGEIVRHTHGGPGHLGHLVVDTAADAPVCRCGCRGCLEAFVSGPALTRAVHAEAESALVRAAGALAIGLQQLAVLYAPDVIALGGGVIEHQGALVDETRRAWPGLPRGLAPQDLRIEPAPLPSDQAGVLGAAQMAQADRR
jgi:glucokinase